MFNCALTDSLSLKIKFDDITVIDKRLTSDTCVYYADLDEMDSELLPPKPIKIEENGITVRIGLAEIPIYNKDTQEKVLTKFVNLTLSSKLLKENYFKGITWETINDLYYAFMEMQIFRCNYHTFLDSMASDVDICINRYSDSKDAFSDALDILYNQAGTKQKHLNKFYDANSIGLMFRTRNSAKPSLPFIKLYHKELELLTKSAQFYNTYLFPAHSETIKNLTRIEVTVRNYEHKKRLEKYGILPNFKTLRELLDIPQKQLYNFVVFSVNGYIETKPRISAPDLSPTDHMLYELIQNSVNAGHDLKSISSLKLLWKGSTPESTKVGRSRMQKKINDMFDLLIIKDVKIQSKINQNAHILSYLEFLNIKL